MFSLSKCRTLVAALFLAVSLAPATSLGWAADAPKSAIVTVHLDKELGTIDPLIFGHFTEEALTSWEGGVSSELLVDRKFSVPEVRNPQPALPLLIGTGGAWEPIRLASNVTLVQDEREFYSAPMSQRISNSGGPAPAGVQQSGFRMVLSRLSRDARAPEPFHFKPGEHYKVRLAIKNLDLHGSVHVALGESPGKAVTVHDIPLTGGEDWKVYQFVLSPSAAADDAKFMIYTDSPGTIWVDSASLVRADLDENGFRKDVLQATRQLLPANVRWPGGLFVSDYHWQDGIGPVDKRPSRLNRTWETIYNNDIGVDEYLAFCRAVETEPYIVVNVGTGTPAEAAELVEYVNGPVTSRWGKVRAQNGHLAPYKVRLWNIGNEEYLGIGSTDAKTYAQHFLANASAMRAVDPSIKLVAVGAPELPPGFPAGFLPPSHPAYTFLRYIPAWGATFLAIAGQETDYYAYHYYEPADSMKGEFSAEDLQKAAMVISEDLARRLENVFRVMDETGHRVPIALDEWRLNIPDKAPPGAAVDLPEGIKDIKKLVALGPITSQLQAVGEAGIYNLMQRRPKEFGLGSHTILYAVLMGMLGISRDQVVFTPTALGLQLYATRDRCAALATDVVSDTFDVPAKAGFDGARGAPYVDVSSRRHPDGRVDVFLVNRHLSQPIAITVTADGGLSANAQVATLASKNVTDWNSFAEPNKVAISESHAVASDGEITLSLPPHSITRLSWESGEKQ